MGMVHGLKKGDIKPSDVSQDVKDAAKSMSKKDAKDYASTKHKGLPKKVKQEILNRLKKEYAFYHVQTRAKKRDHDDDNNLGKKKKYSGQPDIEENKFAKKPEVTPKQLLKIQNDVRKINRKIRVYISKHPVTKGELSIELGHGHDNDAEIHKIYNVLKKHTGSWKTGTMFNESGQKLSKKNYDDYKKDNMNERYRGNIKDFKYDIINALDKVGISPKALKKITKKGKGFEVRMSSYMKNKDAWEKFGKEMGAKLVKFEPGNINIGIYESVNENEQYVAYATKGNKVVKTVRDSQYNDKLFSKFKKDMERKGLDVYIDLLKNRKVVRQVYRTNESVNEVGIFPIKNYIKGMIPKGMFDTTTDQKKEKLKTVVKDLVNTLNHYWKSHQIPYRVRDYRKSDYGKGITR